jgi:hypothetical protein
MGNVFFVFLVLPQAEDRETRMRLLQDGIATHFHVGILIELRETSTSCGCS